MKKTSIFFIIFMIAPVFAGQIPFSKGVNLTNWFQACCPQNISFTKYTKQDFINIQSLGCDVIRLPVRFHDMTGGPPDYVIDPLLYMFLDQVIDWAEELQINLLLDNHTFDPIEPTDPDVGEILVKVWTQLAEYYRDRSELLYFEILNEPHGISDTLWNSIQERVIQAVRAVNRKHTIIAGPAGYNSHRHLKFMDISEEEKVIYTFHFYEPFLFTHQGASWSEPSLETLANVPFPYHAARMPECPPDLKGTWVEGSLVYSYPSEGRIEKIEEQILAAAEFRTQNSVGLFCGEMGVYMPNSKDEDRIEWYRIVRRELEKHGIPWITWDYQGGFGLFKPGTDELFDQDLNIPLLEALGFNIPKQKQLEFKPDSTGFVIYSDYVHHGILHSGWPAGGMIEYYHSASPAKGTYCIFWTGSNQYGSVGFDLRPVKDLSLLADQDYALHLWIKGDNDEIEIDLRFIDTVTDDSDDRPWRMRYTLNKNNAVFDGKWHPVTVLLNDFEEHGAWDGEWHNPRGDFDWSAVDRFEMTAEHHPLGNMKIWLDEIKIDRQVSVNVKDNDSAKKDMFSLEQNYPNPFNNKAHIVYKVSRQGNVVLEIVDIRGRTVEVLVNRSHFPGRYEAVFDAGHLPSGVYLCRILMGNQARQRKMLLLK